MHSALDAEKAVLAAILTDPESILTFRQIVAVEDFQMQRHADIYSAALDCVDRRIVPDMVAIVDALKRLEVDERAGGMAALTEIAEYAWMAHPDNYEEHARSVAEAAARRRLVQMGGEITARVLNGGKLDDIMRDISSMVEITKATAPSARAGWAKEVVTATDLYAQQFAPTRWVVKDILPEGSMLLVGKPKAKKSWAALNIALAVASGGRAFGHYECERGDVLYIDLEMGKKRIHKRLHTVLADRPPPASLKFATSWPASTQGFEEWLDDYLSHFPFTRLVVVDTLVGIRPPRVRSDEMYESDKKFTQQLTNLCQRHEIALLLIHHSNKRDGSDVIDNSSGSTGLTGGVDNVCLLLPEGESEGKLDLRGRDIEQSGAINLRWDPRFAQWNKIDEPVGLTPERRLILQLLQEQGALSTREIAVLLRRDENGTRRLMNDMREAGLVSGSSSSWRPIQMA